MENLNRSNRFRTRPANPEPEKWNLVNFRGGACFLFSQRKSDQKCAKAYFVRTMTLCKSQGGPGTEPEPKTGTVGTAFPALIFL